MKLKTINLFSLCLASIGFSSISHAQDGPVNIDIVYEVFSLPMSDAAILQREGHNDKKFYAKLVEGTKDDKVVQEVFMTTRGRPGQKSASYHTSEFIYATEAEPPELPNQVAGAEYADHPTGQAPDIKKNNSIVKAAAPKVVALVLPATPATPTTFDTKLLGDFMEVEANVGVDSEYVDLRLSVGATTLMGTETWGNGLSEIEMPKFSSQRINTGVVVKNGNPILLGTMSPSAEKQKKGAEPRVWFAFVTAHAIEMKAP